MYKSWFIPYYDIQGQNSILPWLDESRLSMMFNWDAFFEIFFYIFKRNLGIPEDEGIKC